MPETSTATHGESSSTGFFDWETIFVQRDIPIKFGHYDFGSISVNIGESGASFSATVKTGNAGYAPINRSLPEYLIERGIDADAIHAIQGHLRDLNIEVGRVIVKDVAIEGPEVSLGFGIDEKIPFIGGAAHISALRFGLDTPNGDIDLKLKAGVGSGKIKKGKTTSYSSVLLEFSMPEAAIGLGGLNDKSCLHKLKKEDVPPHVHMLFTEASDEKSFLESFDEKTQAMLEQDESEVSKALVKEVRKIKKLQQYDLSAIQEKLKEEERREFIRLSQDAIYAFNQMAGFAETINNPELSKGFNIASGLTSLVMAYDLGMTFTGVGAFFSGANMLISTLSKKSNGDNGIGAGFQALDNKMNMILKLGFDMYQYIQKMDQRISENFLSVFNGLSALYKSQEYLTQQQQYHFGQLRSVLDLIIDRKHRDTLSDADRYGRSIPLEKIKEDEYFKLMKELFLLTQESYDSYLNGGVIWTSEKESGAEHALKDLQKLTVTGKAYGYFWAQLNDLGWIQGEIRSFNPLIWHAAMERYIALGPTNALEVKEMSHQGRGFIALTKALRYHLPRLESLYLERISSILKEMEAMYDYDQQAHDIVSNFERFSQWRDQDDEFKISSFDHESDHQLTGMQYHGKGIRDKQGRKKTVRNKCVANKEILGLSYLRQGKIIFSNYLPGGDRERTNDKSYGGCPVVEFNLYGVGRYMFSRVVPNWTKKGFLWDWEAYPQNNDEAVNKAKNKYKELRRRAIEQKRDSLEKKISEWQNALNIYLTKWYQSCLISGVIPSFCQVIPQFPFDQYNKNALLKPLKDDLNADRNYRDALPKHSEFLLALDKFKVAFHFAERTLAAQRSQYIFVNVPAISSNLDFLKSELGIKGCFIKVTGDDSMLHYLDLTTQVIISSRIMPEKQADFKAKTSEWRYALPTPFVYLFQYDLKKLLSFVNNQVLGNYIIYSNKTHDPLEYRVQRQILKLDSIYDELTTDPKPRVFAKAVNLVEVKDKIEFQKRMIDRGLISVSRGIKSLVDLNEPSSEQQTAQWRQATLALLNERSELFFDHILTNPEEKACPDDSQPNIKVLREIQELHVITILQELCSNASVEYPLVKKELENLSQQGDAILYDHLNFEVNTLRRPLHLAISARRLDIIELLLSYDAKVESEDISAINKDACDELSQHIAALLDFYKELQKFGTDEGLKAGRTLSLIKQGMEKLPSFEEYFDNVSMFWGYTGTGKSSNINSLDGVEYVPTENGLKPKHGHVEKTSTSNSSSSETKYPIIIKTNNSVFVDMPGFGETAGASHETAAGVLVQRLSERVNNVKLMVLVLDYYELINSRGRHFVDILNMYSSIIESSADRINNVLFLINKKSNHKQSIEELIKDMHDPESLKTVINKLMDMMKVSSLNSHAKFLLKNITEKNILISSPLDPSFRSRFLEIETRANSAAIKNFNFASYNFHVNSLKKLISHIEQYHNDCIRNKDSVAAHIAIQHLKSIEIAYQTQNETVFLSEVQSNSVPPSLDSERVLLNKQLAAQLRWKAQLGESIMSPMISFINTTYSPLLNSHAGTQKTFQQLELRRRVANEFLAQFISLNMHIADNEEMGIDLDGCPSSPTRSFGIPGVGAAAIDMSAYRLDADGLWEFYPTLPSNATSLSVAPEIRQCSGKLQPSCVYQWQDELQYLLPKTTSLSQKYKSIDIKLQVFVFLTAAFFLSNLANWLGRKIIRAVPRVYNNFQVFFANADRPREVEPNVVLINNRNIS